MYRFAHASVPLLARVVVLVACAWALQAGVASAAPSSVAQAQRQAAQAKARLDVMRAEQSKLITAYGAAADELARTRTAIRADAKRLAAIRSRLAVRQRSLHSQASFLYRTDGIGFMEVLFGSMTFDEFASRLSVLKGIAGRDAVLVSSLRKDREEAAQVLQRLKTRESAQAKLVARADAQRDGVQGSIDAQERVIGSLSAQAAALLAAQEKAARSREAAVSKTVSAPSASSSDSGEPVSSGSTTLVLASVEGRSGSWWVMEGESTRYKTTGVSFTGGATTYSVAECGTGTASGHPLNDSELTCAHRTLPFGTRIAVSKGSKRIIVKVTDRGPYTAGRVIDLTKRGARLLGVDGVGTVKCEIVRGQ